MLLLAAGKSEYDCREFLKLKFLTKEPESGSSVYVSVLVLIITHYLLKTQVLSVKFLFDFESASILEYTFNFESTL